MEIRVKGKHFDVPEHVEDRAREKFAHLEHYLPLLDEGVCEVDIAHEKSKDPARRFVLHANVSARGLRLQVEAHAPDPETAIDRAAHVLSRQARRHKDRLYKGRRRRGGKREAVAAAPAEPSAEPEHIGEVKHVALKPMTEEEAREQLEALGHDFYVFHHVDEEKITILYRRPNNSYGLIIPETS